LSEAEAQKYSKIGNNRNVIFQYITGKELNNSCSFEPSRWVIYFRDWSLEECGQYPELLNIVKERVKPQRDKIIPTNNMAKQRKELWWKFTGPTVDLYRAISANERALVSAVVGKHHAFAFIPTRYIYANTINVFSYNDYEHFIVLQSNIHMVWALHQGSNLGDTPRYNVSDCFETFPFPTQFADTGLIGWKYDDRRKNVMLTRKEGLTTTYNRFHNPDDLSEDFQKLRALHVDMDNAVAAAYGWADLNLGHGFHVVPYLPENDRVRHTISGPARIEVLHRLAELNRQRYDEEVRIGLHEDNSNKSTATGRNGKKKATILNVHSLEMAYDIDTTKTRCPDEE
jgi:hypothetical protein